MLRKNTPQERSDHACMTLYVWPINTDAETSFWLGRHVCVVTPLDVGVPIRFRSSLNPRAGDAGLTDSRRAKKGVRRARRCVPHHRRVKTREFHRGVFHASFRARSRREATSRDASRRDVEWGWKGRRADSMTKLLQREGESLKVVSNVYSSTDFLLFIRFICIFITYYPNVRLFCFVCLRIFMFKSRSSVSLNIL